MFLNYIKFLKNIKFLHYFFYCDKIYLSLILIFKKIMSTIQKDDDLLILSDDADTIDF